MNSVIKDLFLIAAGAALGSAVTFKLMKDKYEQIVQEEIDSVKEVFSKNQEEPSDMTEDVNKEAEVKVEKEDMFDDYIKELEKREYTNYSQAAEKTIPLENEHKKEERNVEKPYVISPEEFGEFDDYEQISLTYYADHILADDMDELVENLDEVVGFDSLNHFGEYEDDTVFVRNDRLRCDYEICRDLRTYSEVIGDNPHRVEEE